MSKPATAFISLLIIILIFRLFLFYSSKPQYQDGEYLTFTGDIVSEPKINKSVQNLTLNLPSGDLVFIKTAAYPEFHYMDKVLITGPIKVLPRSEGLQPRVTKEQFYGASTQRVNLLNNKTQIMNMNFPKISLVKNRENTNLALVYSIRQKIINVFQSTLPKDYASLLLGIVFGIKEDLSKDFLQSLKTVGVMHVIAASGMNVTMVGGFLFYFFALFLKRQNAVFISVAGIVFYTLLAGLQPSIIRASIMGIIAFSSQLFGKQKFSAYALFLTAFVMLFAAPSFLFDIGFQLSFASTLGILYIPSLFKKGNFLSEDFMTTLSAQSATLPILLVNFGSYSLWSILVNLLVLWTIPLLMVLGGLAVVVSFVFEPFARIILYLCLPFLIYFEKTAVFFSKLGGNVSVESIPWQLVMSYYLFLISFVVFALKRKNV